MTGKKRGTKRVRDAEGFAILYSRQWRFNKYLTIEEIKEEARFVAQVFGLLEIVATVSLFRDILGCRFRKRIQGKGYRWLSVHSAEVLKFGEKPGWVRVFREMGDQERERFG